MLENPEIGRKAHELEVAVRINNALPHDRRESHNATIVCEGDVTILVNGSAHVMEDLWVKLFTERPELRSVVQHALDRMYHIKVR